jgi:uncharacterized protein
MVSLKHMSVCTFFILAFIINLVAQDTITVYYDKDWKEIMNKDQASFYRKAFQDSNKVWTANDYFISGKIQMTGTFRSKKMDVKQGHFIYYFENGQKLTEGNYVNNKAQDEWTTWYENGQVNFRGNMVNDNLEGEWSYFFDNGKLKSRGKLVSNKKEGEWNFWDEKGNLQDKESYRSGLIMSAEGFYENGTRRYSGKFLNGKRNGSWTYWNFDGGIAYQGIYKNGMKEGEWIRYFPGSQMTVQFLKGEILHKEYGGFVRRNR